MKRKWKEWPKKTVHELNSISGLVGVGGVLVGGAGAIAATPYVFVAGCALVGGSILYSGYKAFPRKLLDPNELIGRNLESLESLSELSEDLPKVGVVGSSGTGKSTLIEKLKRNARLPNPTSKVYAVVMRSGGVSPKTFVLLDGAGEELQQQFAVAEQSDVLFLIFDHNESKEDALVKNSRLEDHDEFVDQVLPFLVSRNCAPKHIFLYLNKCDSWSRSKHSGSVENWGEKTKIKFGNLVEGTRITVRPHSNWSVDDVNLFWNEVESVI